MSTYESKIASLLSSHSVPFQREYTFPDLKGVNGHPYRFDFAIFTPFGSIAYLIECQGEQHYEPVARYGGVKGYSETHYRDLRKIRYCYEHYIPLILIPYDAIQNLTFEDVTIHSPYLLSREAYNQILLTKE